MWELLLQNFAKRNVRFTEEEFELMKSMFVFKKYLKHQYILQQDDVCRHKWFIIKGLTRTYEVDHRGQEHILLFGTDDWWVVDLYSFLTGRPTTYNIDCLEETEVLLLSKQNLNILYEKLPKLNKYFRLLLQNAFVSLSQRVVSNLSKPALERYQEFIKKFPLIEQRVPDHQIASYLGVTPQSLSRIRKRSMEQARS